VNRSIVPPPVTQAMDEAESWLPALMAKAETRLGELVEGHGDALEGDARATLKAGGKRLRPMLVLLCAGPSAKAPALRGAAAIELVHMATLVHDDVLDQAPLRRGLPTVVATSGRDRATALGDLLLSRAFAELGQGSGEGGERQVALLAGASVGLALGELAQRRDAWDISTTAERYLERCRLKTARLFECACLIGRVPGAAEADGSALLGAKDPAAGALRVFGEEIGLAFQLLDDVLDVAGPPERTGKARGTDLLDGTVTLPLIVARGRDPELAELDLRALDAEGAAEACDRIAATGSLEEVRSGARERVDNAKRAVAECEALPESQRRLLALVADGVVERYA
jgi:geranylgeranyl pyrophosphate synthase